MLLPKKIIIFDEKTENNRFTGFNTDPNPVNLIDITPFAIFHDSGKRIWQPYIDKICLLATENHMTGNRSRYPRYIQKSI